MTLRPLAWFQGGIEPLAQKGFSLMNSTVMHSNLSYRKLEGKQALLRISWYTSAKMGLDFLLALTLFIVTSPLTLLLAALVKMTSAGPAFYLQTRVGRRGRLFKIVKLRTMHHNCEHHSGVRWSRPGDSRITFVGWVLRRCHLDELPQLWNVLRGDMSLVGPRPERPEFVPLLDRQIPHYRDRLLVRPGLTGLAQVQLPADSDLDSVRRKLACDLYYIQQLGFWLDMRIMAATIFYLLRIPFAVPRALLRVPSGHPVQLAYQELLTRVHKQPEVPHAKEEFFELEPKPAVC